eukprot:jgi/Ulvmu1/6867/UM031_0072.1
MNFWFGALSGRGASVNVVSAAKACRPARVAQRDKEAVQGHPEHAVDPDESAAEQLGSDFGDRLQQVCDEWTRKDREACAKASARRLQMKHRPSVIDEDDACDDTQDEAQAVEVLPEHASSLVPSEPAWEVCNTAEDVPLKKAGGLLPRPADLQEATDVLKDTVGLSEHQQTAPLAHNNPEEIDNSTADAAQHQESVRTVEEAETDTADATTSNALPSPFAVHDYGSWVPSQWTELYEQNIELYYYHYQRSTHDLGWDAYDWAEFAERHPYEKECLETFAAHWTQHGAPAAPLPKLGEPLLGGGTATEAWLSSMGGSVVALGSNSTVPDADGDSHCSGTDDHAELLDLGGAGEVGPGGLQVAGFTVFDNMALEAGTSDPTVGANKTGVFASGPIPEAQYNAIATFFSLDDVSDMDATQEDPFLIHADDTQAVASHDASQGVGNTVGRVTASEQPRIRPSDATTTASYTQKDASDVASPVDAEEYARVVKALESSKAERRGLHQQLLQSRVQATTMQVQNKALTELLQKAEEKNRWKETELAKCGERERVLRQTMKVRSSELLTAQEKSAQMKYEMDALRKQVSLLRAQSVSKAGRKCEERIMGSEDEVRIHKHPSRQSFANAVAMLEKTVGSTSLIRHGSSLSRSLMVRCF